MAAPPLFTAGDIADLREQVIGAVLQNAYTRRTFGAGTNDTWGQAGDGEPTDTTGVACLYLPASNEVGPDSRGEILLNVPSLLIAWDDPLAPGNRVLNVTDNTGVVLLASAQVETVDPHAEPGAVVYKRATLKGVG